MSSAGRLRAKRDDSDPAHARLARQLELRGSPPTTLGAGYTPKAME